jgi:hypothetical protein
MGIAPWTEQKPGDLLTPGEAFGGTGSGLILLGYFVSLMIS